MGSSEPRLSEEAELLLRLLYDDAESRPAGSRRPAPLVSTGDPQALSPVIDDFISTLRLRLTGAQTPTNPFQALRTAARAAKRALGELSSIGLAEGAMSSARITRAGIHREESVRRAQDLDTDEHRIPSPYREQMRTDVGARADVAQRQPIQGSAITNNFNGPISNSNLALGSSQFSQNVSCSGHGGAELAKALHDLVEALPRLNVPDEKAEVIRREVEAIDVELERGE